MTDQQQHPITPPPELYNQWRAKARSQDYCSITEYVAACATQWGADQELEACCEWLDYNCPSVGAHHLRAARRPKPPSAVEQALAALEDANLDAVHYNTILRALEALPHG